MGGLKELAHTGWDQDEHRLGTSVYAVFSAFPQLSFHGTVIGIPMDLLQHVVRVEPLLTGLAVILQRSGCKEFIISIHMPHRHRKDCSDVWNDQLDQLRSLLDGVRFSDKVIILSDLNVDSRPCLPGPLRK